MTGRDIIRFWSKVQRSPDGCWLWTASTTKAGYALFTWGGRKNECIEYAHRLAYRLCVGPIPDGLLVCHKCDNPACVNPDHLFLGSHQDNSDDMVRKQRCQLGERHHHAKLTAPQVLAIRERYAAGGVTMRQLAREYGMSLTGIHHVIRGTRWGSLPTRQPPSPVGGDPGG